MSIAKCLGFQSGQLSNLRSLEAASAPKSLARVVPASLDCHTVDLRRSQEAGRGHIVVSFEGRCDIK